MEDFIIQEYITLHCTTILLHYTLHYTATLGSTTSHIMGIVHSFFYTLIYDIIGKHSWPFSCCICFDIEGFVFPQRIFERIDLNFGNSNALNLSFSNFLVNFSVAVSFLWEQGLQSGTHSFSNKGGVQYSTVHSTQTREMLRNNPPPSQKLPHFMRPFLRMK